MKSNLLWTKEVPPNCTCELLGTDKDDTVLIAIDSECPLHGNKPPLDQPYVNVLKDE